MAVINRTKFSRQLEEGLNVVFGLDYRAHPEEWRGLFDIENSKKASEEDQLVTGFGAAVNKTEGTGVTYDEAQEAWSSRYVMETIALAFEITEEAIEDNQYMSMGAKYSKALSRSMQHTKEIKGAAIYNNAFNASFLGGDGKPLLAVDHPLVNNDTFSNMLATPADFSETALEDILIQIRKAKDDRGIPIALKPKCIALPPELEYVATRILNSTLRPGTSDNDVNAIQSKGIFSSEPKIITRLTDPDAWFIRTDATDGMKHFNRVALKKNMKPDFDTGNYRYKVRERYAFGWTDPRSVFGSAGA